MSPFHLTRCTDRVSTTVPAERNQLKAAGYREHDDEASATAAVEQAQHEADAREAADAAQDGDSSGLPARSASKTDWAGFALASGLDQGTVDAVTRSDLAAHFHDGTPLPVADASDDAGTV